MGRKKNWREFLNSFPTIWGYISLHSQPGCRWLGLQSISNHHADSTLESYCATYISPDNNLTDDDRKGSGYTLENPDAPYNISGWIEFFSLLFSVWWKIHLILTPWLLWKVEFMVKFTIEETDRSRNPNQSIQSYMWFISYKRNVSRPFSSIYKGVIKSFVWLWWYDSFVHVI